MEPHSNQPNLPSSPSHPRTKPLISTKPEANITDREGLQKYLKYHSNTFKVIISNMQSRQNLRLRKYVKLLLRILQTQAHPLTFSHHLHPSRAFQNLYLSSKIKNFQALSSLKLELYGDMTFSKQLKFAIKNLTTLKELTEIQIRLIFYDLTDSIELHKLFKKLFLLQKLTNFSFEMISCARFKTADFKTFFSYLSKFTQFQTLKLSFLNSIDDKNQCIQTLIHKLSSLTSLVQIDLNLGGHGTLRSENLVKLFVALGNLKSLTDITLSLEHCQVIRENSSNEPLSEGLQHLNPSLLRKISLYPYQNLDNSDFIQIFRTLKRLKSLNILDLDLMDSQKILNDGIIELSLALSDLVSLTSFSLSLSSFIQAQNPLQSIASALKSLQNLAYLRLDFSGISTNDDNQIQQFSSNLKELKTSLKFLDLDFSQHSSISDYTAQNIAEAVKELALLKDLSLDFSETAVTNKGLEAISLAIRDLRNLSYISLSFVSNQGISEVSSLAEALRNLPSLSSVNFNFGGCTNLKFEGDGSKSLCDGLRESDHIRDVNLNIPNYGEVAKEVKRLKAMKYIGRF